MLKAIGEAIFVRVGMFWAERVDFPDVEPTVITII